MENYQHQGNFLKDKKNTGDVAEKIYADYLNEKNITFIDVSNDKAYFREGFDFFVKKNGVKKMERHEIKGNLKTKRHPGKVFIEDVSSYKPISDISCDRTDVSQCSPNNCQAFNNCFKKDRQGWWDTINQKEIDQLVFIDRFTKDIVIVPINEENYKIYNDNKEISNPVYQTNWGQNGKLAYKSSGRFFPYDLFNGIIKIPGKE